MDSQTLTPNVTHVTSMDNKTVSSLLLELLWTALPTSIVNGRVWLFYRVVGVASSVGYMTILFVLRLYPPATRYYNFCILLISCNFLFFASLTSGRVESVLGLPSLVYECYAGAIDQLLCSIFVSGFLAHTGVDLAYFAIVIHVHVAAWFVNRPKCKTPAIGVVGGLRSGPPHIETTPHLFR